MVRIDHNAPPRLCKIVPVAAYAPGSSAVPSAVLTLEDRETLLASMKSFAETKGGASVPIEFEIAEGYTASEILARADALPADLLVLGTHGRSGFERLLLGSVTEKVLRKAACPVLSVTQRRPRRRASSANTLQAHRVRA